MAKVCSCGSTDFQKNRRNADGLASKCRECTNAMNRAFYHKNMEEQRKRQRDTRAKLEPIKRSYVVQYLSTHPCVDCGEANPVLLEFDHQPGAKTAKRYEISNIVHRGYSLQTLINEIAKCDVRCVRCHRLKTANERGYYRINANQQP